MWKMIVLIILPVPFNKKSGQNTGQYPFFQNYNNKLHINASDRCIEHCINFIYLRNPFFFHNGTSWLNYGFFFLCFVWQQVEQVLDQLGVLRCRERHWRLGLYHGQFWGSKDGLGDPTTGRWCWPCLRETGERDDRWHPPPGKKTWWAARTASSGSCLTLQE